MRRHVTGLVYNDIDIETGTAGRDMADQSFVEDYTVAGQEDVAWTLGGSQGRHRARVRQRTKCPVLDAVHGLSSEPVERHY